MGSIPLPALDLKPVQQPDVMGDVSKLMALKSMMGQQQLQQQEIQIRGQQVKDQQATTAAMKTWDGQDYDALARSVLQNGGSATAAQAVQQHGLGIKKAVSDIAASDATTGSKNLETFIGKHKAIGDTLEGIEQVPDDQLHDTATRKVSELAKGGILDPQAAQQALQVIQSTPDPTTLRQQIDVVAKSALGAKAAAEQAKTQAETAKDTAQAGEATATQKKTEAEMAFYARNGGAPGVPVEAQEMADWLNKHPRKTPSDYMGAKAALVAQAELPSKIAAATAEGKARQMIQGMERPVYAIDPRTGQKSLMSATDALQSGIRTMLPVTEKEVADDTMLINRLGDVRQKTVQYGQALSKLGSTISDKDQGNLAAIIGSGKFKLGAFGSEVPVDRLNAALKKENIEGLSDDAIKALAAYYNARESMAGYNRVLSGSNRGGEKQMELNLDTLPDLGSTDPRYAVESLRQFAQNLKIVGQGLPTLPGVKSPDEIERELTPQAGPRAAVQVGQTVMIGGRPKRVTAVHQDGSFDAQ